MILYDSLGGGQGCQVRRGVEGSYWPHVDKDEIGSGGNDLVVPGFCWIGDVGFWLIKSW